MSTSKSNKILPTLQIEVDIFSGRPNPKWILTEKQTKEFLEFSQWHEMMVTQDNLSNFEIGFNGFIVTKLSDIGTDLPHKFHLVNPYRPHYHLNHVLTKLTQKEMVSREQWLLGTAPSMPKYDKRLQRLSSFIKKKIEPQKARERKTPEKKAKELVEPCPVSVLQFDPASWNKDPTTVEDNNCYNYATNNITNTFAQPGRISGKEYTKDTCADVKTAAKNDGMIEIAKCSKAKSYYKIALVIAPDEDYHWYRLQTNKGVQMWGHKRGEGPVIDFDANGDVITDPQTCDRDYSGNGGDDYSDWCGYYYWPVGTLVE